MKIIDISKDLMSTRASKDGPKTAMKKMRALVFGDEYNLSGIAASLHSGTHVKAPAFVFGEGEGVNCDEVNDIPLDKFIGPVRIITLPSGPITGEMVEDFFPKTFKKVIFRMQEDTYFFVGAAEDIASLGYDLIGVNKSNIGGNSEIDVMRALLSGGTVVLENLNLNEVSDGDYYLLAQPIKIQGAEASFVRALLIDEKTK